MFGVLNECHVYHVSISSNFARKYAFELGLAASLGLITTETAEGFSRQWRPTATGLDWMQE